MKLNIFAFSFFYLLTFCGLPAQIAQGDDDFYKGRILKAPESVFSMFIEAGMDPSNHVLTAAEQAIVDTAFSLYCK